MIKAALKKHWMAEAMRNSGLKLPDIPPGLPTAEVWRRAEASGQINADELARKVAGHFRLGVADLAVADLRILKLVPEKLARRYTIFPLAQTDRRLFVATADPTNLEAEQAVAFSSGRIAVFRIASPDAIQEKIDQRYSPDKAIEGLLTGVSQEVNYTIHVLDDEDPETVDEKDIEKAPIVKLANVILRDAIRKGASDIHVEPETTGGVVRYRLDGVLRKHMYLPIPTLNRVVSRLKVIAKLDISDRLRPHDGRARVQIDERIYDLRFSTVPTRDSEKAVIRILETSGARMLKDLTLPQYEFGRLTKLLSNREGMILVTGPTGSGKTTTLYGALRELANGQVNVTTVEDPVECQLPGVTQIQVDQKRDVTFASALRAILRQDPDVVLVGEIRDLETARMAIQAGMTGHLVLSTLHTNDAIGAVARLSDIGLDHASIAATLRGIVAQRLVRRVCSDCVEPITGELEPEEQRLAAIYGHRPTIRARGCLECGYSGYRGRMPVQEVVVINSQMQEAIAKGASPAELQQAAQAGGLRSMRSNGVARAAEGLTTLAELDRVLGDTGEQTLPAAGNGQPHVLVVDDDPVNRRLARSLLQKQGYRVSEAADGVEALEQISAETYSLMILDLMMPRLDGRELLSRLRSSANTARMPVIVLSGSLDESSEAELMHEGADDYIRKPLHPERFLSRVTAVMRRMGS